MDLKEKLEELSLEYEQFDSIPLTETIYDSPVSTVDKNYVSKRKKAVITYQHAVIVIVMTVFSFWTRFREIDKSKTVIWDEAHFGKFGSYYLRNEFYFDVHPPLGKMLIGLSGYLANYNGSFPFESGSTYPDDIDVYTMRVFSAAWGALLVPLAYGTALNLELSSKASILAASMALFDNALLTISRFILLDSMLLFFTGLSFFCLAGFRMHRDRSFSTHWWLWLFGTGLSLGCVLSVKWIGLFTVALVGLYTIEELWDMLGDIQMPKLTYLAHWTSRALCLILVPIAIYVASFATHFYILRNSGPNDSVMNTLFQASLNGSFYQKNPVHIAFGSNITIKSFGYAGGLLHSHGYYYPEGSRQQQITCYPFKDSNNIWQVRPPRSVDDDDDYEMLWTEDDSSIRYVKNNDIIRLFHRNTRRNLHSHPINAHVNYKHWEVSAYGDEEIGDVQDNWKIEMVRDVNDKRTENIRALTTVFRLRHVFLECYLASRHEVLPDWGFKQQEVYCDKENNPRDSRTWWSVEDHHNKKLPPAPKNAYKHSFLQSFLHLNLVMWYTNNALIPDPDKDDILASNPKEWPMVSVGLRMCGWDDDMIKFYLIGNPSVWWLSFASIVGFSIAIINYTVRLKRQVIDMSPGKR
ncbi:Putative Dolichyl-phosphate-mannose-protein mannosyltransferase [Rhizopus microsporus]|nr:Putative Dolichyl-phosphate-mannose-protein mannosyltransferase [Rhizopus microsporus]